MNTSARKREGKRRGMLLIEVVVYLAVFFVALGIATEAFYQCWSSSKALRRDADDVSRSVRAGERWRADVRGASGPILADSSDGAQTLRIPQAQGDVVYRFANSELRRRSTAGGREAVVLSNIKSSEMQSESKSFGVIWRWELELASKRARHSALRPLFTFEAVARGGGAP